MCIRDRIDSINVLFGQVITDSKLDKSKTTLDPKEIVFKTGQKLEAIIVKYYKDFQNLKNRMENYLLIFEEAILKVDFNLRDLMSFYNLLPRFHLVYTRIYDNLKSNNNSIISFYRDKITEILYNWQKSNKKFFHFYSFFMFWIIYAESLFELPFNLTQNTEFKYTMIERTVESWLDTTTHSLQYKNDSDNLLFEYKNIFQDVKNVFDGLEEYANCLLYTSPSPRDLSTSRMPSSA